MEGKANSRQETLDVVGRRFVRECRGRRLHPQTVRVGKLGGAHIGVPNGTELDTALRADLLERILNGIEPSTAIVWITRGGALAPNDQDFGWYGAARAAFGRHGHPLPAFYVITRDGWFDLVSDQGATWRKLTA